MSHIALRSCVGCRTVRPRPELVRLATEEGRVRVDSGGRMPGRGAYLCLADWPRCLELSRRHRGMARSLRSVRVVIDYSELESQLALEETRISPPR